MNHNYNEVSPHTIRKAMIKKSTNNKCLRGWECKSVQPLWKTASSFLKRLKIELPHDSAILVLGIDPEKKVIQKDTCTPVFTAAVYTIGRTWKQPRLALGSRSTMLVGITQSFEVLSRKKGRGWVNSLCLNWDVYVLLVEVNVSSSQASGSRPGLRPLVALALWT